MGAKEKEGCWLPEVESAAPLAGLGLLPPNMLGFAPPVNVELFWFVTDAPKRAVGFGFAGGASLAALTALIPNVNLGLLSLPV